MTEKGKKSVARRTEMNLATIVFLAAMEGTRFPGCIQYLPKEVLEARSQGAETKVVFHVVDDEGRPVKDASVGAVFYMNGKKGYGRKGLTDGDGWFTARQMSVGEVNYWINKDGYYETHGRIWFAGDIYKCGEVKEGKWQPYGKTYETVLKPIKKPTPMYVAPTSNWITIPMTNTVFGFDFEKNDLEKPYGIGLTSDFTVEFFHDGRKYKDYAGSRLVIRFIRPFDGVYRAKCDLFSEFKSTYHANTNMVFTQSLAMFDQRNTDGKWTKNEVDRNEYLVMRTRSKVDKDGKLISAHYSKIYGPVRFGPAHEKPGKMMLVYFHNPIPNDTNLESDVKKTIRPANAMFHSVRIP